jgi:hypothetical protein
MYEYIVHLERDNTIDWMLSTGIPGQRAVNYRFYNSESVKINETIHECTEFPGNMETWYSHTLETAELLAAKIAVQNPGRSVNVYELKSVQISQSTPPVKARYTEKGLVPV